MLVVNRSALQGYQMQKLDQRIHQIGEISDSDALQLLERNEEEFYQYLFYTSARTKDEELSNLDAAYKKTVDDFVTMETTNQHARGIIGEEMNKISKITTRSTLASAYIEEQKTRGKDEIPENLTEKMYGAITSFKEKYTMIQPNREQLLMSIKI